MALAFIEALAFLLATYLAASLYLRNIVPAVGAEIPRLWLWAVLAAAMLQACMLATGLYSTRLRATYLGMLLRLAASVGAAGILVWLIFDVIPRVFFNEVSRLGYPLILITALLAFVAAALIRFAFSSVVGEEIFKRRVLVYGCGRQASSIAQLRRRADQRGFHLVGYLVPPGARVFVPREKVLAAEGSLLQFARRHRCG